MVLLASADHLRVLPMLAHHQDCVVGWEESGVAAHTAMGQGT